MSGCPGWNAINPVCRGEQVLDGAAKSVSNDIFSTIAHYFEGVAQDMVSWLWQQLNGATSIDLTTSSIKGDLIATGAIAALITFALFLIQVIASAIRQDSGGLGRAVRGIGISFIGAAFAVATTQLLLAAVDALCSGVASFALHTDISGMGSKLVAASALSQISNPAGVLLISLVLIVATVVVWVALMIRKMLIIISAVFAPIAFSGAASDVSRSWVRRWIEFTLALIFSKLILVIIFMIGLSVLSGAGQGGHGASTTLTNLAVGTLTLLLAGFAPWIAIKLVHFAGESFHAVHMQAATAPAGARAVIAAPQKASALVRPGSFAVRSSAAGVSPSGRPGSGPPPGPPPPPGRSGSLAASSLARNGAARVGSTSRPASTHPGTSA